MKYVQQVPAFPAPCPHGVFSSLPIDGNLIPQNRLIQVEAGPTRIGRSWDSTSTYGWDNEFGNEKYHNVPAFAASEFLVSNFEFQSFVADGGYATERYWSQDGWQWVSDMKPAGPRFWKYTDTGLKLRTLTEEIPMAWDWPAEVNHHEAAAFCKYLSEKTGKNLRLPVEDECLRLRDAEPTDLQDSRHGPAWGGKAPGNVNLDHWSSSCPVNHFESPSGIYDVLGNVWQHSLTTIDVCPGFQTHPLYDDFTTPTVGDGHSRIMGGSWISTGTNGGTRDARFGFRRHFYQHAGFRYVESDRVLSSGVVPYERDRNTCDAFRFHFEEPSFGENFPVKLAQACIDAIIQTGMDLKSVRVLELGCGPGRTVMELAKHGVSSVYGAARTAKEFNGTVQHFMKDGRLRWVNFTEGDFVDHREISMDDLDLREEHTAGLHWHQIPDFANIDQNKFQNLDVVVCAQPSILSESDAVGVLSSVHKVLKPGGLLVVGSQYDWVPKTKATSQAGGDAVVSDLLKPWFEPVHDPVDISFVKAETARKFSCGNQHITFWKRNENNSASTDLNASSSKPTSESSTLGQAMYDDKDTVGQYLDFHFGPNSDYPVTCASRCIAAVRDLGLPLGRALEIGGGPGRAGFELSKHFQHVDSGDYSQTFVDLANKLMTDGKLDWRVAFDKTAGMTTERSVTLEELGAGNITFSQMDAQALPATLSGYDLICGFNLIDRLPQPKDFLLSVKDRLQPGGLLVLSSPYTWLEEFTSREEWLGAYKYGDNDGPSTYIGMKEILLAAGFDEAQPPQDIWFRIDEMDNGRKSQQTCAQMTFWKLR
jgi:putative 4-mercaptohistidine N1-methyltranferase